MPNPKRRHSHTRTRTRRAHHALDVPQYLLDKDSGEPIVPNRINDAGLFLTHKARKNGEAVRQILVGKEKE